MNKRNIILTGASGFIGRYMAAELLNRECGVYVVVRDAHKADMWREYGNCHTVVCELNALNADLFPKQNYDAFIHMAWGGVNREEIDDMDIHRGNYMNSVRCLQTAHELNCRLFADTGSRAEYGMVDGACKEDILGDPDNAYGKMKLEFYNHAFAFCQQADMGYIHFRLFSVIGIGDHPWSLVSVACNNFSSGIRMDMGACRQLWNFMSVQDAVRAMLQCIDYYYKLPAGDNCIVNIASADTRILRDFIYEIHQLADSDSEMLFDETRKGYDSDPSVYKLNAYIGWKDQTAFKDEIINILSNIKNHRA